MIFYFSGTGNSKLIAYRLAEILEDELYDITSWLKSPTRPTQDFNSVKPYIFVAPTYAWQIAKPVSLFMACNTFNRNKKAYFVLTCGDSVGNASGHLKGDCKKANLIFMGLKSFVMPENYIALFDVPSKEKAQLIVQYALGALEPFCMDIKNEEPLEAVRPTLLGKFLSSFVNRIFYALIVKDKKFYTTSKCTRCGWCKKSCPLNNITIEENSVKWLGGCTHCMACICGCPQRAIEYGKKTANKNRHYIS